MWAARDALASPCLASAASGRELQIRAAAGAAAADFLLGDGLFLRHVYSRLAGAEVNEESCGLLRRRQTKPSRT